MPIENFSGNPISSTYQRVVQTDGTYLGDGTGSIINNLEITASYALTASYATYAVSASYEIIKEESSSFADTASYVNPLTQSLLVSGSATITGTTTVGNLRGSTDYNIVRSDNSAYISFYNAPLVVDFVAAATRISSGRLESSVNGSFGVLGALSARLHVKGSGTTSATTALRVENSNASASLAVLDNGYVGIGTAAPSYYLHVNTNASNAFYAKSSNHSLLVGDGVYFTGYHYHFAQASSERFRISMEGGATSINMGTNMRGINFVPLAYAQLYNYEAPALSNGPYLKVYSGDYPSGSFSGSWVGMYYTGSNGYLTVGRGTLNLPITTVSGSLYISGSTISTGGFTGSLSGTASAALTASSVDPLNQAVLISGSLSIQGTDTSTSTKAFHVQTGDGTSIMDFRNDTYAFFGCGQGAGAASGFIFRYNNPSIVQMAGYNYGNGSGGYRPIFFDTDIGGRNQGVFINYSASQQPSSTEFAVKGRGATSSTYTAKFQNSNLSDAFVIRDDGNIGVNTSSPLSRLHINDTAGGSNGTYVKFTDSVWGGDVRVGKEDGINNDAWLGVWTNNNVNFYTNGVKRLTIDTGGNTGFGTNTPSYRVDISGSARITNGLIVTGSATISGSVLIPQSAEIGYSIGGAFYRPYDSFGNTYAVNYGAGYYGDFGAGFYFRNGSAAQLMRVHQNGRVAISSTVTSPAAKLQVEGEGATSATTGLLVQNSSANPALTVRDDGKVSIGNTSAYPDSTAGLYVGTVTAGDNNAKIIIDPYNTDATYYKLVLESRYNGAQPFSLYSSNVQTWLYGYGNPMQYQPPAMKIPNQISMGTTDIGKSEISGSVLFIHGQDFYARQAYVRMTSYTTGVDTLRGSVMGLWTGDKLRLWNYENTSVDLGVNNVQRLQVTPSGINVTGSIVATGNLTLGTAGRIASGEFANPTGNSSIAMGYGNTAAGNGSLVVGFISDTDSGKDYSAAIGYEARAYLPGQVSFAWGNHTFNNRDAGAQQSFLTVKNSTGVTTGATMDLSIGGNTITLLGTNRAWMVTMDWIASVSSITGTATGVSVGDTAGGTIRAVVKKVGGVTSVVGTIANDKASDASMSSLSIAFVVGGSNQLIPRITGPTFAGGGTINIKAVGGIKLSETSI